MGSVFYETPAPDQQEPNPFTFNLLPSMAPGIRTLRADPSAIFSSLPSFSFTLECTHRCPSDHPRIFSLHPGFSEKVFPSWDGQDGWITRDERWRIYRWLALKTLATNSFLHFQEARGRVVNEGLSHTPKMGWHYKFRRISSNFLILILHPDWLIHPSLAPQPVFRF